MKTFVGLDAGGTKTHVLVADEKGNVILGFEARGADISSRSSAEVEAILYSVLTRLTPFTDSVAAIALGMPGCGEAERWTSEIVRLSHHVFGAFPVFVFNDVRIALEGAFPNTPGVIALSGTGSTVWAKDESGNECRVGGWGTLFGDEGSSYAVGVAALRAVSRALDGRGPDTALRERLLTHFKGANLWNLYELFDEEDTERAVIASFAQEVDLAARAGDEVAVSIWYEAAEQLAEQVHTAYQRLHLPPTTPLACVGGTFHSEVMGRAFATAARERGQTILVPPAYKPSFGAVFLAQRAVDGYTQGGQR